MRYLPNAITAEQARIMWGQTPSPDPEVLSQDAKFWGTILAFAVGILLFRRAMIKVL